jgi:hypothetical protein
MIRTDPTIIRIFTALLVIGLVGVSVVGHVMSDSTQAYINQSEQWCNSHNGELVNVQAVIGGGLHCDLPNGTSVHMRDVVEVES